MPAVLRAAIFAAGALLWLSGVLWLVLHYAFEQRTQFGLLPNSAEPFVMRVHGVLAVCGVFLLGWIGAAHAIERFASARGRLSGLVLSAAAAVLVVSGYALYYTVGTAHDGAAVVHEILGAVSLLVALAHWWRRRPGAPR